MDMDEPINCPLCNSRLTAIKQKNIFLPEAKSWGNFITKTCLGINHLTKWIINEQKEVIWLMLSLNQQYTKFIIFNYRNQECQILCSKNNIRQQIQINKLLVPDFPDLSELKRKVDLYIAMS